MKARTSLPIAVVFGLLALCPVPLAAWTEPVPLTEVNTGYHDKAPFLSFDGLTLYFCRQEGPWGPTTRIYQATRQQPYGPFTSVEEISTLNLPGAHVADPWVSPDNLRMYYCHTGSGKARIMLTKRVSTNDPWLPGVEINELNILGNVWNPDLIADELTIVFSGDNLPGGLGGLDIWMATRPDSSSPFGNVTNLAEINSSALDVHPYISPDGLTLYFASNRNGTWQLFKATRESLGAPFGNLEHLSFFDSPGCAIQYPFLSSDGSAFYYGRWKSGEMMDIYVSYIYKTYYVDAVNGDDNNDGLTLKTAFTTIQKGINTAEDGDTVLVYPGLYQEQIDFLDKTITVQGVATTAGIPVIENPGDFAVSFYLYNGKEPNSTLKNFVIRNSFTAIFIVDSSPTIANLTIVDNKYGITAYAGADPDISNCIFWNNTDADLFGCQARYSWVQEKIESKLLEGLISYWKFDEGSGSIASDSAGTNNGTIYGATWTDGALGGALGFDGVNDYVDVPDSASLRFSQTDSFSISCWAMPIAGDGGRIVCKMRKTSATGVFGYETLWQPALSGFWFSAESSWKGHTVVGTGQGSAPAGNWYHFTAVYSNKNITLYLNGQPAGAGKFAYNAGSTTPDKNLSIGVRSYDSRIEDYFEGRIDDVRIYDRALSAEEVQRLFDGGLTENPLFADPNNGDYHLLSERGRYWPQHDIWVLDKVTSPCVDGGDPGDDPSGEPMPNGGRIDMGAYGGTPYASMSEWPVAGDVNHDGVVDLVDMAIICNDWLFVLPWVE